MGYHYRCRHEFIVFMEKGKRKLNNFSMPDVLVHKMIRGGYPTEKPIDLFKDLISQSTDAGQLVVDPFCGSGAVAKAAVLLGRNFICGDISHDAIQWSVKTMKGLTDDLNLFGEK